MPFGQSASGWRSVSCVGVTADFASQSSGPRPAITSPTKRTKCAPPMPTLTPRLLAVVVRHDAAVARLVAATVGSAASDDAAQAGRRVRGVDLFEDGRLGRGHEVLQRFGELEVQPAEQREHDREQHAERGGLAVVAAEAVLERVPVDEQQDRDRRVVRAAAGEQERLEEHLRGRDDLQDQHDEQDAAQLGQRDVPDLVPDRRAVDLGRVVELGRHAQQRREVDDDRRRPPPPTSPRARARASPWPTTAATAAAGCRPSRGSC